MSNTQEKQKDAQLKLFSIFFSIFTMFLAIYGFFSDTKKYEAYEAQMSKNKVKVVVSHIPWSCRMHRGDYVGIIYKKQEYKVSPSFFQKCSISVGDTLITYHTPKHPNMFVQIENHNYYNYFMWGYIFVIMILIIILILIIDYINFIKR